MDEHEKKIEEAFGAVKSVSPSASFAARSRTIVLMTAARPAAQGAVPFRFFVRRLAIGAAVGATLTLVFVFLSAMSTYHIAQLRSTERLLEEARVVEFQIQLGEARYFKESAEVVSVALEKISQQANEPSGEMREDRPRGGEHD